MGGGQPGGGVGQEGAESKGEAPGLGSEGAGEGGEGGTWRALSSMSAGLARAASRAVVVVPMLEPRKRGYARSRLITPTPGGTGGGGGESPPGLSPRA